MTISISPGKLLVLDNVEYRSVRRSGDEKHVLENTATLAPLALTDDEVVDAFSSGRLSFGSKEQPSAPVFDPALADFESLPDSLKNEARRRYTYVVACLSARVPRDDAHMNPIIASVAAERSDPRRPSRSTVNRWIADWIAGGGNDLRPLVPRFHFRGRKKWKFSAEVYELAEDAIARVFERRERVTKSAVHEYLRGAITLVNAGRPIAHRLPIPSMPFVCRLIRARNRYEQMVAQQGKKKADEEFRPVITGPLVERPLERVEIDSTQLDEMIMDDVTGVVLGRPTLTLAFDCYSAMIIGFYLGFEPPSAATVLQCIRHSILSKSYVRHRYPDIKGDWPCHGPMSRVVFDRGTEGFNDDVRDSCNSVGIKVTYMPVDSPWFKGSVERMLGTINTSLVHQLPGTTFSNTQERGDYDSVKRAALTLGQLDYLIHMWIIDYYSRRVHTGIQDVPIEKWKKGCNLYPRRLPESLDSLNCLLGGHKVKPLSNKGIELEGLFYNDDQIRSLRTRHRADLEVHIRYDLSDLGSIRVLDPVSRRYFTVAHVDQDYTKGLRMVQHKLIRRIAKAEADGKADIEQLSLTRKRIIDNADEMARRNRGKKKVGRNIARALELRERKRDEDDQIDAAATQYEDKPSPQETFRETEAQRVFRDEGGGHSEGGDPLQSSMPVAPKAKVALWIERDGEEK
jgi:putative transposase